MRLLLALQDPIEGDAGRGFLLQHGSSFHSGVGMSRRNRKLGDSHNFGRRVVERDGRIGKPRTVFWEWLLLCADSPLRALLDRIARLDDGQVRFDFLPSLRFDTPTSCLDGGGGMSGEVERIALHPLQIATTADRQTLAEVTGRAIALYSWLGLGDLHWENMALGSDSQGRVIFAPLDVELMLDDHDLPTATRLLPEADPDYAFLYQHACGVRRVLPFLGKPLPISALLAMVLAYHQTLAALDRHSDAIAATLSALPGVRQAPLRVCLRSTGDYLHAGADLDPPLLRAEIDQLDRGDIPYFFRLYGRPGIHYFTDSALATSGRLPGRGDVPQLAPLLSLSKGLRSPRRRSLAEQGLFCLLSAFDHPSYRGEHTLDALHVRFSSRRLLLRLHGKDELETHRDLRDHVTSVYLPCQCGEVDSPLVPHVTRCHMATAGTADAMESGA